MSSSIAKGTVKAVLSGDTVIVMGRGGQELLLSLSHLAAPRLARAGSATRAASEDEPFAWTAREFLRSNIVGKVVRFRIDYKVRAGSGRGGRGARRAYRAAPNRSRRAAPRRAVPCRACVRAAPRTRRSYFPRSAPSSG